MKHYNSPVITFIYYRQTDVVCASDSGLVEGVSTNDTDVIWTWGGNQ